MARLSGKQQRNIEAKWALEEELDNNLLLIADSIRELVEYRGELKRGINAFEEQVPESVQGAWDQEDVAHIRAAYFNGNGEKAGNCSVAIDRGAQLEAYRLLESVLR
jgi:hypothetical protein